MTNRDTEAATVTQRLDKLERQNRWLKGGLLAMALGMAAVVLMAAKPATMGTVRARSFVLLDGNGKTRAKLALVDNEPFLVMAGSNGNVQAALLIDRHAQPRLELDSARGNAAVVATSVGIAVDGRGGAILADLVRDSNGLPDFAMFDHKRRVRAGLSLLKDGQPVLGFYDARGTARAGISLDATGQPNLELSDARGANRLSLGSTTLTSRTQGGTTITPVSSVIAFDKKGNVIGKWPLRW